MFSARSAATDADDPRPGPAAGTNVKVEAFIQYALFIARVICVALLAAGG